MATKLLDIKLIDKSIQFIRFVLCFAARDIIKWLLMIRVMDVLYEVLENEMRRQNIGTKRCPSVHVLSSGHTTLSRYKQP